MNQIEDQGTLTEKAVDIVHGAPHLQFVSQMLHSLQVLTSGIPLQGIDLRVICCRRF